MSDARSTGREPSERERTRPPWKLIGLAVVVAGLVVFFLQNGQRSEVKFLMFDVQWPLWTIIGISVVIGVVLDRLGTWQWRRARARRTVDT